jgi:predicted SpoU family rRNA methylase
MNNQEEELYILRQKLAKTEAKFDQVTKANKYMAKQLKVTETKLESTEVKLEESNKLKELLQKIVEEFKENLDISTMVRWANSSERFKESDIKQLKVLLEQNHVSYTDTTKQDIGESGNYIVPDIINDESEESSSEVDGAIDLEDFLNNDGVKKKRGRQPHTKTSGRNNTVFAHLKGKEELEITVDDKKTFTAIEKLELKFFKKEERKQLDYIKEHLRTRKTVIYYYIDKNGTIYKSKENNPCIYDFTKGGKVTNRTTAAVSIDKVLYGQPINLQANKLNIFAGATVVNTQLLNNQFLNAGLYLSPVSELIRKHIVKQQSFHADETRLLLVNHPNKEGAKLGYMWSISCKNKNLEAVYFRFDPTRKATVAKEIFEGCGNSAIQVDGYSAYVKAVREMNREIAQDIASEEGVELEEEFIIQESFAKLQGLTLVACAAHCRRKFYSLYMAVYKNKPKSSGAVTCGKTLAYIKKIYAIEKNTRQRLNDNKITNEEFIEERKSKTLPVLTELKEFLIKRKKNHNTEKKLSEAINYMLNQFDNLLNYLDYVDLTPDNNFQEAALRTLVRSRKASLFASTEIGAKAWANITTLAQSAIMNGLNPTHYVKYLLDEITLMQDEVNHEADFERLLPWNLEPKIIDKLWYR